MIAARYIMKTEKGVFNGLLSILQGSVSHTQYAPGCQEVGLWSNCENLEIMINEIWRSKHDLEAHFHSEIFRQMLSAFELCIEKPEVQFFEYEQSWGLDWVEQALLPTVIAVTIRQH